MEAWVLMTFTKFFDGKQPYIPTGLDYVLPTKYKDAKSQHGHACL